MAERPREASRASSKPVLLAVFGRQYTETHMSQYVTSHSFEKSCRNFYFCGMDELIENIENDSSYDTLLLVGSTSEVAELLNTIHGYGFDRVLTVLSRVDAWSEEIEIIIEQCALENGNDFSELAAYLEYEVPEIRH